MILIFARLALAAPDRTEAPAVAAPAPFVFPVPQQLALADGAPVWLIERHETPLVRVMLNLSAGTVGAEDPVAARVLARALQDWREVRPAASAALEDLGASLRLGLSSGRLWVEIEALSGTEAEALARGWGALFGARAPLSHGTVHRASQVQDDLDATLGLDPDAAHERALLELSYPWDHPIRLAQPGQGARRVGRRAASAQWRDLLGARAARAGA